MSKEYDLIVIGAGSGNSLLGPEFSDLQVALLDDNQHFGGTCLNYGCIPTKMLMRPAVLLHQARQAARLGVEFEPGKFDWSQIRDRVFGLTDGISESGLRYRQQDCSNVDVYRESFTFISPYTLRSRSGEEITGRQIVIAAGSRPRQPFAFNDPKFYTSAELMRLETLPGSLIILGGGVIAVEMATIFSAFGVEVTTINRSPKLMSGLDAEVAESLTAQASWRHIGGQLVRTIERSGEMLAVTLESGQRLEAEAVLSALGRVSNADVLACAQVGFELHSDGRLKTDEYQRVIIDGRSCENIFALGDVSDPNQLKHIANHQARAVAHNLLNQELMKADLMPAGAVFSEPQIAWVGDMNAADVTVRHNYSDTAYGWALGLEPDEAFVKLAVSSSGKLTGAVIIGPEASMLIQPLIQAASLGLNIKGLARSQYWPHPAAIEVLENALLKAEEALGFS